MRTIDWIPAFVAVDPGTADEHMVPIYERLFVGRDPQGVEEKHRLLIDDEAVSRYHCEIRLEPARDSAFVVDTSTNGTRLNGTRIERSVPALVRPGDQLQVGVKRLEFRSDHYVAGREVDARQTVRSVTLCPMAMVVGDILKYSTISQYTEEMVLLQSLDVLYGELRKILTLHRGTLNNYVGDAFFAVWEIGNDPDAGEHALRFALDAVEVVKRVAPALPLRDPLDRPITMGWGAALGGAAVSTMTGMLVTVLGDTTNVAFRLSGLAGREGRAPIMATRSLYDRTHELFAFGEAEEVPVKGRTGTETVRAVLGSP